MTLPINRDLPYRPSQIKEGGEELAKYMKDLTKSLDESYTQTSHNIDGALKTYTPKVAGSAVEGVGTYSVQYGLALRQGIRTTVWFSVGWTAHTGAGILYITLPYQVADFGLEFVSCITSGTLVFGAGYTILTVKARPNAYRAELEVAGSGVGEAFVNVQPAGHIRGQLFYIGKESET